MSDGVETVVDIIHREAAQKNELAAAALSRLLIAGSGRDRVQAMPEGQRVVLQGPGRSVELLTAAEALGRGLALIDAALRIGEG